MTTPTVDQPSVTSRRLEAEILRARLESANRFVLADRIRTAARV